MVHPPVSPVLATLSISARPSPDGTTAIDATVVDASGGIAYSGPVASVSAPVTATMAGTAAHPSSRFERYLEEARSTPPVRVAVVHPCHEDAVRAAIEARDEGLIEPLLVGPEHRIRQAAAQAGADLRGIGIEPTEHSHASAEHAVRLATAGRVAALMKGSLHTDELLGAVVAPHSGLRTQRRISHVYVMDVPTYPKLLTITDAAINIAPTLEQKRDIIQNAVDFLGVLGITEPSVAVLAAVETVNSAMPATIDAAALSVMARRGQIRGATVDGPLAFDNAISLDAARIKEISSAVSGHPDVLVVPNLEAGNMLAKQLIYLAGASAAGLVLGTRVPVILTSRADSLKVRLASVAMGKLLASRESGHPFIG